MNDDAPGFVRAIIDGMNADVPGFLVRNAPPNSPPVT
jgi:hypothetical protein